MAQTIIQLDNTSPNFDVNVNVSDNSYILKFKWNVRGEFWVCGIYDSNDNVIVAGQKLCANYPLFQRFASEKLPSGLFWIIDTSGNGLNRQNLGSDVVLMYED